MKPNLFDFAPKELSQDAFFAWLISYSNYTTDDIEISNDDQLLKKCSLEFIQLLLNFKVNNNIQEIKEIRSGRQWRNIDLWIELELSNSDKYLIIIEDKTITSYHSDQLKRYKDISSEWCIDNGYNEPICIYLKTGNESNYSLKSVIDNGYYILDRKRLCDFFKKYNNISNNIFYDYTRRLNRINDSYYLYKSKAIGEWNDEDWQGFFMELDANGQILSWSLVNNAEGGFWNAIIEWPFWKGFPVHYQIEQGNLYFKICFDPAETDQINFDENLLQDEWHNILNKYSSNDFPFKRSYPFVHRGKTRTVGLITKEDWLGNDDELLDMTKVISNITRYKVKMREILN